MPLALPNGQKCHHVGPYPTAVATTAPWLFSVYPYSHHIKLCVLSLLRWPQKPPLLSSSDPCSHHSILVVLNLPLNPSQRQLCPKPTKQPAKPMYPPEHLDGPQSTPVANKAQFVTSINSVTHVTSTTAPVALTVTVTVLYVSSEYPSCYKRHICGPQPSLVAT